MSLLVFGPGPACIATALQAREWRCRSHTARSRPGRRHLDLQPVALPERVDGIRVRVERVSMRQHRLAVDDALDQQVTCPLEAVEDSHGADDVDLVVVHPEG